MAARWAVKGPHRIASAGVEAWTTLDKSNVAVWAQYPDIGTRSPLPVIVLCHGLGGGHRGYNALGAYLASHGYAVLHPQFLDSFALASARLGLVDVDERTWPSDRHAREQIYPMLFDPHHWVSRVARVHAVTDSLARQRHLPVRLVPDGVILAGHSYGAYTAQLVLGTALFGVGLDGERFTHPAVVAGILMSPQGSGDRGLTARSWAAVELPLLVVTGTNDRGPRGESLRWRRQPFDAAPCRLKHLAVVRDGDHYLGGIPLAEAEEGRASDVQVRRAVSAVMVAFVDRVRGDRSAGAWLASSPFSEILAHEHQGLST
ncbi:MAG: alpha/beta hydrolase family protein [Nocardioidaceae bacterium]